VTLERTVGVTQGWVRMRGPTKVGLILRIRLDEGNLACCGAASLVTLPA